MEYLASIKWVEQEMGPTPGPVYNEWLVKNEHLYQEKLISICNHKEGGKCWSHTLLRCCQRDSGADGGYTSPSIRWEQLSPPQASPLSPFLKAGPYKCGVWGGPLIFPNLCVAVEWDRANVQTKGSENDMSSGVRQNCIQIPSLSLI